MQGVTDGEEVDTDHQSQEKVVPTNKENGKIHLGDAAFIGDTFALGLDVSQHPWDGGGGETDVYKGRVGEEEVHESDLTARIISRFPSTVIRYMDRKSPNMTGWFWFL